MGLTSVFGGGILWGFEVGSAGRFRVVSVPAAVRRNNNRKPGSEVAVEVEAEAGEGGQLPHSGRRRRSSCRTM